MRVSPVVKGLAAFLALLILATVVVSTMPAVTTWIQESTIQAPADEQEEINPKNPIKAEKEARTIEIQNQKYIRNLKQSVLRGLLYAIIVFGILLLVRCLPTFNFARDGLSWFIKPFQEHIPRRKLWDWLQLIGGSSILGLFVGIVGFSISSSNQQQARILQQRQENLSKRLQKRQEELAKRLQDEKEKQGILTTYINDMTGLIERNPGYFNNEDYKGIYSPTLERYPSTTQPMASTKPKLFIAVGTRTLNAIDSLSGDGDRQGQVLRFAVRAFPDIFCSVSSRDGKTLNCSLPENLDVKGIVLRKFDITQSNSTPKDLFANKELVKADLSGSTFDGAKFPSTSFRDAILNSTTFTRNSYLYGANFAKAKLLNAQFSGADLSQVLNLSEAVFGNTAMSVDVVVPEKFKPTLCKLIKDKKVLITYRVYKMTATSLWSSPEILGPQDKKNAEREFEARNRCPIAG
jgi:hypothetical protein